MTGKKIFGTIFVLGLFLFLRPSYGNEGTKTIYAVADTWCPYNCNVEYGKPGYIVEILRAVYEAAGYQLKYEAIPWTRAIQGTRSGQYDILIGAYREDAPDFLFPNNSVGISHNAMAQLRKSQWVFQGTPSFEGRLIAFVAGYSFGKEFDEYLNDPTKNVMRLYGADALLRALRMIKSGGLQGVLDDRNVLAYKIRQQGLSGYLGLSNSIGDQTAVYVAFSPAKKRSLELKEIFDIGVVRLRKTGKLDKIMQSYHLKDWSLPVLE